MSRTKSLGEFAVDAYACASELPKAMAAATGASALEVTNAIRGEIRHDSGGDMSLSGMGRVGARYDLKGVSNPVALIRATGPVHIMESGAQPHLIAAGGRRTRRRKGAKALVTPYGPKANVHHPGSPAKHTWSRGVDSAVKRVPKVYQEALAKALRRHFG